jgi:hypothetical protein
LILGRRRHILIYRQVRQKRRDFCAGHLVGMSFVVEEDVTLNPSDIGFLRANRVVLEPDGIAHLVKQFLGTVFHGSHLTRLKSPATELAHWGGEYYETECPAIDVRWGMAEGHPCRSLGNSA